MIRVLNSILLTILAGIGLWWVLQDELAQADRKILFVGNSFLFVGDVPAMVRDMAGSATPPVRYHIRTIAKPNYTLMQHVTEGEVQKELASGVWDVVVLQDQSAQAFSIVGRLSLGQGLSKLGNAASSEGADVLVFAHWAPGSVSFANRDRAVERIASVYADKSASLDAQVAQVGRLWQMGLSENMRLYSNDGHHASFLGAYAAAVAVLQALGDVDPAHVTWQPDGLDPIDAARLRALAAQR
ncbi:hypothetical protein [Halovulum sp. GXIMD14793]